MANLNMARTGQRPCYGGSVALVLALLTLSYDSHRSTALRGHATVEAAMISEKSSTVLELTLHILYEASDDQEHQDRSDSTPKPSPRHRSINPCIDRPEYPCPHANDVLVWILYPIALTILLHRSALLEGNTLGSHNSANIRLGFNNDLPYSFPRRHTEKFRSTEFICYLGRSVKYNLSMHSSLMRDGKRITRSRSSP